MLTSVREITGADGDLVSSNEIYAPDQHQQATPNWRFEDDTLHRLEQVGFDRRWLDPVGESVGDGGMITPTTPTELCDPDVPQTGRNRHKVQPEGVANVTKFRGVVAVNLLIAVVLGALIGLGLVLIINGIRGNQLLPEAATVFGDETSRAVALAVAMGGARCGSACVPRHRLAGGGLWDRRRHVADPS